MLKLFRCESGLRWLWLAGLVLILDQLTKLWISSNIPYGSQGIELNPFLRLVYVFNSGAAFSFLADASGWQRWLFTGFAIGIAGALLAWLKRLPPKSHWIGIAIALIIGGALGNLIDRLYLGHVIDFIDLYLNYGHFPRFNLADCGVCVGALMLVLESFFNKKEES
ncbi:signal peptidase II [Dongshaea marina]|uniref:signal peptidase II n=1 Tax=Dongshaea marina TaxID=2047966 RepID=UPI000D3E5438|nr:signal peptidase II [Dongshaea marina]